MNKEVQISAIYTYKSPFELEQIPEWSELKKYPHLCISQTLVEGLKEFYGRSAFQLLATVDSVFKKFYEEWHDSPENTINQTIAISDIINEWEETQTKNQKLVSTMKHNKNDLVMALRMMIESDIKVKEIDNGLAEEEILLLEVYKRIEGRKEFSCLNAKQEKIDLDRAYLEVLKDEIKKYLRHYEEDKNLLSNHGLIRELDKAKDKLKERIGEYRERLHQKTIELEERDQMLLGLDRNQKEYITLTRLKSVFEYYKDYEEVDICTNKVVLHGVHQFSPLILRFIKTLNRMGVEVIALFNYMSEYPEIYKTWKTVYSFTNLDFLERGSDYGGGRKLGEAIGRVYERDFSRIGAFQEKYYMFDHLTSFSDYVGDEYEKAVEKFDKTFAIRKKKREDEEEKGIQSEKLIKIALMEEQFYAINGSEINELLKVYFPEQFSSRHFLTYPVGQFILSLYRMWDDGKQSIVIKGEHIKEALALDIWRKEGMPTPLEMFNNLEYYFRGKDTFEGYILRLENLTIIAKKARDLRIQHISFFIYNPDELAYFKEVLSEIRRIAESIFTGKRDNLKENFQKLIEGIKNLVMNPSAEERVTRDEKEMLSKIQARLEELEDTGETTYISNIKETLGYYIQASTSKEYEAEWIVRDFEQIDGGILLAAAQKRDQKEKPGEKTFHYAGVSDENLLGRAKKELPWPLTTKLYEAFDSEIAKVCAICRNEYNYFLRYSLFYGTYFLTDNKQIRLSYIKELGDQEANPYSILAQVMKLKTEDYLQEQPNEFWDEALIYDSEEDIIPIEFPKVGSEQRSMETCFKRYLWNHCLDEDTYFYDEFQLEQVAKFFIEYGYLEEAYKQNKRGDFDEGEFRRFIKCIPIFDRTDYIEIETSIRKKLSEKEIYRRKHGKDYIDNVMEFIFRRWSNFTVPMEEVRKDFEKWLDYGGDGIWIENCKGCNQRKICGVIEDEIDEGED